jgi:hypothetical protein
MSPRRNWGSTPTPLSPASVPLPPEPGGGRAHSPAGEGLGESHFRRLEKKLSTLPTLWRRHSVYLLSSYLALPSLLTDKKTTMFCPLPSLLFYLLPVYSSYMLKQPSILSFHCPILYFENPKFQYFAKRLTYIA